jgi:molybdopterin-containing oxidoreductase family iron-sulfur binding subunit
MENKQYWRGIEELNPTQEFNEAKKNEFMEGLPLDEVLNENASSFELSSNRRDFLKFFGFSMSAVALAACNTTPIKNVIPYVVKPENITPGVPNYYASTCGACAAGCGILVKTREGRPIKVDGNEKTFNAGKLCAQGQASVLGLYDDKRIKEPMIGGAKADAAKIDSEVIAGLKEISAAGGQIRIVTGSVHSPSTLRAINEFAAKYKNVEHVTYDAVSASGIIAANEMCFGKAVVPTLHFNKARVIVSVAADFLGTWISPVEYTMGWAENRKLNKKKEMSRHIQFESNLSITGSNADVRIPIKPSQEGLVLVSLYNEIAKIAGGAAIAAPAFNTALNTISTTAQELVNAKGAGLVVAGTNDVDAQIVVNAINSMLGNIGNTVDLDNYSNQYKGNDTAFEKLVSDMNAGSISAVIFSGANPVYNYYNHSALKSGLDKVKLKVSTSYGNDETAQAVKYVFPDNHYLESWNDAEPKVGQYQLAQPTITKIFKTRQAQESILTWAENNTDFYTYIKETWKNGPLSGGDFTAMWNQALHDGVLSSEMKSSSNHGLSADVSKAGASAIISAPSGMELKLYEKVAIGDGSQAGNPWLQELPDPISKACWDNYVTLNKSNADEKGIKEGDTVSVTAGNVKLASVPVIIQPGQAKNTVGLALGYGQSEKLGAVAQTGVNAFGLRTSKNGHTQSINGVKIEKDGSDYVVAQTQTHHTIEGRNILKETTLDRWTKDPLSANHSFPHVVSLWDEKDYKGHRWAMAIDLNSCTGCGACVVACQAENNVAVVGREEVIKGREMQWIRIDRYYSFTGKGETDAKATRKTREKEIDHDVNDWENVSVAFQPMLCQHCAHASCETVCPVLATTHSSEGLNQMTYNRCIGTKYCANNCPYKVRRFNWFKYHDNNKFDYNMNNDLGRMVLNPDVTVRSRGVMEKCSFCVQRINSGKLSAKREGRVLEANEIKTACQVSCPSNAIVFGDRNNPESEISKLFYNQREYDLMTHDEQAKMKDYVDTLSSSMNEMDKDNVKRAYAVLEEINMKPSIKYLTKVRNRMDASIDVEIEKDRHDAEIIAKHHKHAAHAAEHGEGGHEGHPTEHKDAGHH